MSVQPAGAKRTSWLGVTRSENDPTGNISAPLFDHLRRRQLGNSEPTLFGGGDRHQRLLLTAPDIKERPANELPWMEEAHGKTEYQRNGKRCAGRG
jgi:hypothetical protein